MFRDLASDNLTTDSSLVNYDIFELLRTWNVLI